MWYPHGRLRERRGEETGLILFGGHVDPNSLSEKCKLECFLSLWAVRRRWEVQQKHFRAS